MNEINPYKPSEFVNEPPFVYPPYPPPQSRPFQWDLAVRFTKWGAVGGIPVLWLFERLDLLRPPFAGFFFIGGMLVGIFGSFLLGCAVSVVRHLIQSEQKTA